MLFSKKIKLDDIIKNLLFFVIILSILITLILKINKSCNNCIIKHPEKILNAQGYLFDIKKTLVEEYDPQYEEYGKSNHTKPHFNLRKTTGFFTSLSNYDFYNPRVSN